MAKLNPNLLPNVLSVLAAIFVCIATIRAGRMTTEGQSFQEMFDKANLVVIATAIKTSDTAERARLLDTIDVIGIETEYKVRLILKGSIGAEHFILHHYREVHQDSVANGPALIKIPPEHHPNFLMFLTREKDGRYAPVTGQIDPALFSIIELKSGGTPEGPEGWSG